MDILLIDPPYMSLKGVSTDCGYHMGLTCLAAFLRSEGVDVGVVMGDLFQDFPHRKAWNVIDYREYARGQERYAEALANKDHVVWKRLAEVIAKNRPRAIGVSYLTPARHSVEKVAALAKEIDKDIKVIAGSSHPTCCPEEVMQNQDIDFSISGEGEIALLRLVKEMLCDRPDWQSVPGLHYRGDGGNIHHTQAPPAIQDLDRLPFPARELVLNCDYARYRDHAISTARGCPYTCSFCADKELWRGKVRRRTIDNVIQELTLLMEHYRVSQVDFIDGTFTYDRVYLEDFCRKVISLDLGITWRCTARYDNLDEDLVKLMKKANCSALYFGMESGSNRILKATNKHMKAEDNIRVSNMVHDSGIFSVASILLGVPGETKEDLEATLKLMKTAKVDWFDVNSYVPLPGSALYESAEERDRQVDWRKIAMKSYRNHFSGTMTHEEFNSYLDRVYEIANRVHRTTILRMAARMPFNYLARLIK